MPRPLQPRHICVRLGGRGFLPVGRRACDVETVVVSEAEVEAIRLVDLDGLYQEAAAERMGVSRATFARTLSRGRTAIAESLVGGKALLVRPDQMADERPAPADRCPVHDGQRREGRRCRCAHRAQAAATAADAADGGAQEE